MPFNKPSRAALASYGDIELSELSSSGKKILPVTLLDLPIDIAHDLVSSGFIQGKDLQNARLASKGLCEFFKPAFDRRNVLPKLEQLKLNPPTLAQLLQFVVDGNLEKVRIISYTYPELLLEKGTVIDCAGRVFENITALQYAEWALDDEMWEVILRHLDKDIAKQQLEELSARDDIIILHGRHFNFDPLIIAYDNFRSFDLCTNDLSGWCKWAGNCQLNVPAWFIYAFCEEELNLAWTKKGFTKKVMRDYEKNHLSNWRGQMTKRETADQRGFLWIRGYGRYPTLVGPNEIVPGWEDFEDLRSYRSGPRPEDDILLDLKRSQFLKSRQTAQLAYLHARLGLADVKEPPESSGCVMQ